ncbi:MAG: hypothetical protein ABSD68_00700 [Candidatus Micrarchaeales archaeon]
MTKSVIAHTTEFTGKETSSTINMFHVMHSAHQERQTSDELIDRINDRVLLLKSIAEKIFCTKIDVLHINIKKLKFAAATTNLKEKTMSISNKAIKKFDDYEIDLTIGHEIAHLLVNSETFMHKESDENIKFAFCVEEGVVGLIGIYLANKARNTTTEVEKVEGTLVQNACNLSSLTQDVNSRINTKDSLMVDDAILKIIAEDKQIRWRILLEGPSNGDENDAYSIFIHATGPLLVAKALNSFFKGAKEIGDGSIVDFVSAVYKSRENFTRLVRDSDGGAISTMIDDANQKANWFLRKLHLASRDSALEKKGLYYYH